MDGTRDKEDGSMFGDDEDEVHCPVVDTLIAVMLVALLVSLVLRNII